MSAAALKTNKHDLSNAEIETLKASSMQAKDRAYCE